MLYEPQMKYEIIPEDGYDEGMDSVERSLSAAAVCGEHLTADGFRLYYEYYRTNGARSSIIILHGFTEFTKKYHELCWYFINMGYNVMIYDQRGHGLSARSVDDKSLAHIDSFSEYADDLEDLISAVVKPLFGSLPLFIYSHSMGGAVACDYLERYPGRVSRAVMSSPMFCPVTHGLPRRVLRRIASKGAEITGIKGKFRFSGEFNPNPDFNLSSDISHARFRRNLDTRISDTRYQNSSATNGWMYEALSISETLLDKRRISAIGIPVLVFSAGHDRVVRRYPQSRFARLIPRGRLVRIKNSKHSIYTASDEVIGAYVKEILSFFSEKLQ